MRAIQADIFRRPVITLRKINHGTILVSALNEIINQRLLVLFGNKIIEKQPAFDSPLSMLKRGQFHLGMLPQRHTQLLC